jgi:hypothetical protein
VFLWQVKLTLLLKTLAGVELTQDLEGRPMLGELLRDTALRRNGGLRGLSSIDMYNNDVGQESVQNL